MNNKFYYFKFKAKRFKSIQRVDYNKVAITYPIECK